jgi:iron complex outermembrane receptor protein
MTVERAMGLVLLGSLAAAPGAEADVADTPSAPATDPAPTTGSRLAPSGVEGALPVTVITREEIDASGRSSLADLLRDIAANSFGSFRPQSGSSAQSLASINLRGLGSDRTLILVDGRRAPQAPFAPTVQDLNAIPLGAVERIEVLREGASAIYGSGAVGGVVNIVVRKDFQGTQFMHGRGYTDIGGGDARQASFVMGMPTGHGRVVIGASYNSRDIVFARDYVAAGLDQSGASNFGNNYVTPVDGFSSLNAVPGGCQASSAFFLAPDPRSDVDTNGDGLDDICQYDFKRVSADEAASDNMGLFANGRFDISDAWSVYATATVSRATSFGRYAPAPAILFVPGATSGIDHDGDGTDDTVYVYHRYDALGNRDDHVDGEVYDLSTGLEGSAAGFMLDAGARFNEYKSLALGRNYVVTDIAAAMATSGVYDFRDPSANAPATLSSMKATISRDMHWRSRQWWASASRDLFALPAGPAPLRFGVEHDGVEYADRYDSLSEGFVIGGTAGNSAGMDRDTAGYFAELGLPLLARLSASVALRYDDVSGDVGDGRSARVAAAYEASPWLTLRGGWNRGFTAPALDALSQQPSFSAEPTVDVIVQGNPELESEDYEQYSAGLVLVPLRQFSVTLDYHDTTVGNAISFFTASELFNLVLAGEPLPDGLSLTFLPGRDLVTAGYGNFGEIHARGLDLGVDGRWSLGETGRLTSRLQASTVLEYEYLRQGDTVGRQGAPEWRANWNTAWRSGPLGLAWNQVAIAGQEGADGWWTHDVQVSHDLPFSAGTLTVGALNVTDEAPPSYNYDGRPFNFYLYNGYGRTPYVRYTLTFR